jgi:hypothetical protein
MDPIIAAFLTDFNTAQQTFDASEAALFDACEQLKFVEQDFLHTFHGDIFETELVQSEAANVEHSSGHRSHLLSCQKQKVERMRLMLFKHVSLMKQHSFAGYIIINPREEALSVSLHAEHWRHACEFVCWLMVPPNASNRWQAMLPLTAARSLAAENGFVYRERLLSTKSQLTAG